jgi:phospholipase C
MFQRSSQSFFRHKSQDNSRDQQRTGRPSNLLRKFPNTPGGRALMRFRVPVALFLCIASPLLFTGCGNGGPGMATAPTVSITSSPSTIATGGSSQITVTATNATQVTVSGSDGSNYTLQSAGGSVSVSPKATTTYTATVTGAGGTATANTTVTVSVSSPTTVTLTANPTSMNAGDSSILTVTAQNATGVTLAGSDGTNYTLTPSGGTQAVSPASTTTYTATASGTGGNVTATATVTVTPNPPPTVTITANPTAITDGSSSTLTVTATNSTEVSVSGSDGSSYPMPTASGGTQSVSPASTTTYTATAKGPGGSVTATATLTVSPAPMPTVSFTANPTTIVSGNSSLLTVTASNASQVTIAGTDGSSYTLPPEGGNQSVSPTDTTKPTTYTVTAKGAGGSTTVSVSVTVVAPGTLNSVNHVIFMMQENHTFDNYFGMLNPYRKANGWNVGADGNTYTVDGIEDKLKSSPTGAPNPVCLPGTVGPPCAITNPIDIADGGGSYYLFPFTSTCVDDMSSDWPASFGDVTLYDLAATRQIKMNGFVHNAAGYAKFCSTSPGSCAGTFTDMTGMRAMGYYDQNALNYYYYMASQFALSDRWFSPVASYSVSNRIATFTGGTTQGLVKNPGGDGLNQLNIPTIFQELDTAGVSWKIYYTVTQGFCLEPDDCNASTNSKYPATFFSNLTYSYQYLHENKTGTCAPPTQPSSVVGDSSNSFCIDPNKIAPLSQYFKDLTNGTLPSFVFIEAGYGQNDEHPGSQNNILLGQQQTAKIVNALMASKAWASSVFFWSYDEGGGPYDHVPPVPGHTNDMTDPAALATAQAEGDPYTDISAIAVNPDEYYPCVPPTGSTPNLHCDLDSTYPGANPTDAAAPPPGGTGFGAQLGFRVPDMVISPFAKAHYVSHAPMDHTAIIKFVENRFIGPNAHLTARDASQPNLLNLFDFANPPWETPPTPPAPASAQSSGPLACDATNFGTQP